MITITCLTYTLLTKLPLREDEEDVVLALVSTLSLFAKGSKSVSAVILQKEIQQCTHNTFPYYF